MPSLFEQEPDIQEPPRYYRWSHPNSPYVIELRLDLIDRMLADLRAAQSGRLETGGVLVGTFVRAANPTLRIEDYELIGRRTEDGLAYNLTPDQRSRFAAVRHKFVSKGVRVLGFFRSQIRGGPLTLSAEDRELLQSEFRRAIHIALLVRLSARPTAGFLVPVSDGEMQTEPAWNQFPFETAELTRLTAVQQPVQSWQPHTASREEPASPAVPPPSRLSGDTQTRVHAAEARAEIPGPTDAAPRTIAPFTKGLFDSRPRKAAGIAAIAALALTLLFTVWGSFTARLLAGSNRLELSTNANGGIIELHWNHYLPELQKAQSATLTIQDGNERRELTLPRIELRSGSIAYQRHSSTVVFTLVLNLPGSMGLVQSTTWTAGQPSP